MRADITPRHGEVVVDGLRLHYLAWGDPANPAMLMLHGIAQQAHSWDFVAMDLGQDHYVVSLDQRGHGDSDWAPDQNYTPEAYQGDLEGVVEQLGLDQFILVGLSMGGMNAVRYAAAHQDKLRGLIVVDMGPQARESGGREIRNFMAMDDELDSFEAFVERTAKYNPLRPKESFRGSLQHNLKQLPSGKWTWKYDRYFRSPDGRPRGRANLWPFVRELTLPVLIVRGEKSHVFAEEDARVFATALPDVQAVAIPDAGHLVPGDQPDLFSDAVRAWLESRRPEAR
jgi:pimeloyl-ACP methyl ester carboxylesterase